MNYILTKTTSKHLRAKKFRQLQLCTEGGRYSLIWAIKVCAVSSIQFNSVPKGRALCCFGLE